MLWKGKYRFPPAGSVILPGFFQKIGCSGCLIKRAVPWLVQAWTFRMSRKALLTEVPALNRGPIAAIRRQGRLVDLKAPSYAPAFDPRFTWTFNKKYPIKTTRNPLWRYSFDLEPSPRRWFAKFKPTLTFPPLNLRPIIQRDRRTPPRVDEESE